MCLQYNNIQVILWEVKIFSNAFLQVGNTFQFTFWLIVFAPKPLSVDTLALMCSPHSSVLVICVTNSSLSACGLFSLLVLSPDFIVST